MDYGKTAYLKAEDLERRLMRVEARSDTVVSDITVRPVFNTAAGKLVVTRIRSGGSASYICLASVRVGKTGGVLSLAIGGMEAGSAAFDGKENEVVRCLIMGSAKTSGGEEITLSSDAKCVILTVQIMAIGSGADMSSGAGTSAVDKSGSKWILVDCSDGDVAAYSFTEDAFALGSPVFIGEGNNADVAATDDGAAIAYVDPVGNAFLARLDQSLALVSLRFVCDGAASVALHSGSGRLYLAAVKGGKARIYSVSETGGVSDGAEGPEAESVLFVKNSSVPMLVTRVKNKNLLRIAATEYGGDEKLAVSVSCAIETPEVTDET